MSSVPIEDRLAALERDMARLKAQVARDDRPWWDAVAGTFADDPIYDQIVQLGREYRESLRTKRPRAGRKP
ncbi:hypothetical protein [Paludisphaera rhizosphaerae]|uniref:hypothetical protein n=1 Tax=Paludisphaera rhizosphaerae TaxID=2711216 RepID=UPI00197E551C|nr:hypothetical protein [Paludisphaera rhizosphaerae]